MRMRLAALLMAPLLLCSQETPRPNRVTWFEVFPEPLPEGVSEVAMEVSSQYLRPDRAGSRDKRTVASLDGEEWQLTADLPLKLGPAILNLRLRAVHRSGGIGDQTIVTWHSITGLPDGGRNLMPKNRLAYHLERDGVTVGDLNHSETSLMDADLACLVPFGTKDGGGRVGGSIQLPTGSRRDFSGSGGWDGMVGAAGWKRFGTWRVHGQLEQVFIGLPSDSPYRKVLGNRTFTRAWVGGGFQGQGSGFWRGFGVDLTLAYTGSPYAVRIARIDDAGLQQHWTITHKALPRWRFGFSEEAGSYTAPDITFFVSRRFGINGSPL